VFVTAIILEPRPRNGAGSELARFLKEPCGSTKPLRLTEGRPDCVVCPRDTPKVL